LASKYTRPTVRREAERVGALTPSASLTNVAYKEATMATIEVTVCAPLVQPKLLLQSRPP